MMTMPELAQALNKIYPTRFSHFTSKQVPPFICYLDEGADNHYADDVVQAEFNHIDVELYTKIKDLAAEKKLKDFFKQNELAYEKSPTIWIESEGLFYCTFSITLNN